MADFDDQSTKRISNVVRDYERRLRNSIATLRNHQRTAPAFVAFELLEEYAQFSETPALARLRDWDSDKYATCGGFLTDCTDGLIVKVIDAYETGHTAGDGGLGRGEVRGFTTDGYTLVLIHDLCCPGDEQGVCAGSGS